MKIVLGVLTDGRAKYLEQMMASLPKVGGHICDRYIVDDSGNGDYGWSLNERFLDFEVVSHPMRLGLAAAVNTMWRAAVNLRADYLFHVEEDFTFDQPIDVELLAAVMRSRPHLSQIVLKRQPWSHEEIAAGGIVEMAPQEYETTTWGPLRSLTEHRRIFSLNPCLIPRRVFEMGWPDSNEAGMTELLNRDPANRFAFWGAATDPPVVTHIGAVRSPAWAL